MSPVYPARAWNALAALVRSAWPLPGVNARLRWDADGVMVSGATLDAFSHPWRLRCSWEPLPAQEAKRPGEGEWRASVEPGFVNGRDAFIAMPEGWPEKPTAADALRDVALTDEQPPYLVLRGWRNPVLPSSIGASLDGEIVFGRGEGYPAFFASLGVRPASKGGKEGEPATVEGRTREIRAADVVLTKPRLGSALGVNVLPLASGFTHQVETTYQSAYYVSTEGRAKLTTTAKFAPLEEQWLNSPFLGLPMNAGDPQFDQVKIGTVYVVSEPGAGAEAVPDATWQAYPRHDVFWNLWHATRFAPPAGKLPPIRLVTGLGLGILDVLANAFLAPINSGFDEAAAFLRQSDLRGKFWT